MPGLPVKGSRQAGEQRVVGVSTAAEASLKLKRCIFMATIKGPGLKGTKVSAFLTRGRGTLSFCSVTY